MPIFNSKKTAILVVDMLNDFVTGVLGCDGAKSIIQTNATLLNEARKHKIPVIFCNDAHYEGIDLELKLWGNHAIKGTKGAEVIPELEAKAVQDGGLDYIVDKRRYSGFFATDLDLLLRELGVESVILTGLHTHMCVRHTSADAYFRGYEVIIAEDATSAFTPADHESGIAYLKLCYGAKIHKVAELVGDM